MGKKRRVVLHAICELCGSKKVIARPEINTQTIKEISISGAMLGGLLGGWGGALLGGAFLGKEHHTQDMSVIFECQECTHESTSCDFQNNEGEELSADEVEELLEEASADDADIRLDIRLGGRLGGA